MPPESSASPHDLLPWFVTGSLSGDERREFEAHLPGCRACGEEVPLLRTVVRVMRSGGERFLAPHPEPERLVAALLGEAGRRDAAEVRRHLRLCSSCEGEARCVRRAGPAGLAWDRLRAAGARHRVAIGTIAAAAVAVAVLAPALSLRGWIGGGPAISSGEAVRGAPVGIAGEAGTAVEPVAFVLPTRRAAEVVEGMGAGVAEVRRSARRQSFTLVLQVDAVPSDLPVAIEIRATDGRVVYAGASDRPLLQGIYLPIRCAGPDFPDGDYTITVRSARDEESTAQAYQFRVATE